jgi:hypothetical protein
VGGGLSRICLSGAGAESCVVDYSLGKDGLYGVWIRADIDGGRAFSTGGLRADFALTVQNRVIRLEERLRYERILPEDLKARAGEFSAGQMIALRFASDAELPGLARKVLDEKLKTGKEIKQSSQNWRPDYLRA